MLRIISVMCFSLSVILLSSSAFAEKKEKPKSVESAPKVQQGNIIEPTIKIIEAKTYSMHEYRIDGVLRAIKVIPKNGAPAYFLVDRRGSGDFERLGPDIADKMAAPEWELFSW